MRVGKDGTDLVELVTQAAKRAGVLRSIRRIAITLSHAVKISLESRRRSAANHGCVRLRLVAEETIEQPFPGPVAR